MNSSSGLINALLVTAVQEEYMGMMLVLSRLKQVMKRKKRKQRIWTRPRLLHRGNCGIYETLLSELQADDAQSYKNFLRMDVQQFRQLLGRFGPRIEEDTHYRKSIYLCVGAPASQEGWKKMITLYLLSSF